MAEQSHTPSFEIDGIVIDPSSIDIGDVDIDDVPADIAAITSGLVGTEPQTNPIVILKAARWWYLHGRGLSDPVFQWAIEWTRYLATDEPPDVRKYDTVLDRLVKVGFAGDRRELRSTLE